MQPSYDALLDDFPPFLYSPEPLAKEIPTDPWYSFHAALDNQLPDALASGTPSHSFAALPLSYGSSSSTDSDFYGYNGLDDFAGSPTSDSSSSSRSLFDDSTLSPPTSVIGDRDETFASPTELSAAPASLFGYDHNLLPSLSPRACPSPLTSVPELSSFPNNSDSSRAASPILSPVISEPTASLYDSDADADGESDDESDSDDSGDSDYVDDDDEDYSPARVSQKKPARATRTCTGSASSSSSASRSPRSARAHRYSPYSSPRISSSSSSSSEYGSPRARCPQLKHTSARKQQVSAPAPKIEVGSKCWNCPHCNYVQQNHRHPDLTRHIEGHYKKVKYVCCGVPLHLADHYGVVSTTDVVEWQGKERVGGCWHVFSRRDALIRHLKNPKKKCVNHEILPSKVLSGCK